MDLSDYTFQPDLARASTIPARWYTDPAMLAAESRRVFGRTWQCAGQPQWVAEPGSYFGCEIARRAGAGGSREGRRAARLLERLPPSRLAAGRGSRAARTSSAALTTRWTYSLDGRLLGQPEFEGVRTGTAAGPSAANSAPRPGARSSSSIWTPQAPPLAEVMGEIPAEIAEIGCPIERLRYSCRRDYVIECNWKVYIDNYLEGYHLPAAHPSLFRELDYAQYRVETLPLLLVADRAHPRAPEPAEARRYEFGDSTRSALYYWIFPNFMLNVYPDNLSSNIILPLGPDKTLTIFEWFAYDGRGGAGDDRFQRRDPAGRHRDLRKRAERPAVGELRPGALLGETGKRGPPFPRAAERVPAKANGPQMNTDEHR